MSNPFKYQGFMLPIASINKHIIDGKKADELFSPVLISRDLKNLFLTYDISSKTYELQDMMKALFEISDPQIQRELKVIGNTYGYQLVRILQSLVNPTEKTRNENLRWKEEHWAYWKEIKHIYLMGGLASSPLSLFFTEIINEAFQKEPYNQIDVHMIPTSQEKALDGMLERFDSGHFLLFDFGQTHIKRSYVIRMQGLNLVERKLEPLKSQFLDVFDLDHILHCAYDLERYIEDVIIASMHDVSDNQVEILISIANYVHQGVLNPGNRSYGILSLLSNNYQSFLEESLSFKLKKRVQISLVHDATAMSYIVQESDHTAVLTLGTAFGIAFIDK